MTTAGLFSTVSDSLFGGDILFEVAYSENVGTLVFSGHKDNRYTEVYIISPNSNWEQITHQDKYLKRSRISYSGACSYSGFAVTEHKNKIFIIGGHCDFHDDFYHRVVKDNPGICP